MSKKLSKPFFSILFLSFLSTLILHACIEDDEGERQAVMCTEANGGTGCYEYLTTCGTEAIGTYKNKKQCEGDRSEVEAYYDQYGEYTLGSNALYAGNPVDNSGSGGSGSGSGSVLNYGGYTHSYSCPVSGSASAPIPPTVSSHCETIYERVADEVGCNIMDDYNYLMSEYQKCIDKEVAACSSASTSDPNC